ncbi:hypothetical protein BD410DRAFT_150051 [Rickenella mellea]|uniref:Translation machinery-associated protein 16 n=1 Tax=Rickenella mellea TaxID=50990 RepID=A0A4Y7Q8V9_9AGAM|nr:hypothetical protein BD410DRAFT_150051 [Rickenella mellea]
MAPTQAGAKVKEKKEKNEKVFHPNSRKAGQIERSQLRRSKLTGAASKRLKHNGSEIDKFVFFFHSIPPEQEAMTLEELHMLIKDVWLTRHDIELEEERAARRKGRPKSAKEMKYEAIKITEAEEYRTGLEVPDLTHPVNVEIFRRWDQRELAFIQLLRFIRISSENPAAAVVSKPGKHMLITLATERSSQDVEMAESQHSSN